MILKVLLLFLLFFLPIVVLPFGVSPFETPKILLAEVTIGLFLIILLFQEKLSDFKKINRLSLFVLTGIFLLALIHILFLHNDVVGNIFRFQGVLLLWILLLFALGSSLLRFKIPDYVPVASLVLIVISSFIQGFNLSGRLSGSLGEPNALATFLIFLNPFFLMSSSKKLKFGGALVILILLLLTQSRSGILAFSFEVVLYLLTVKGVAIKKSFLVCMALLVISFFLPFLETKSFYENRARIWQASIATGFHHPIMGWGFGNQESGIREELKSDIIMENVFIDSSHNVFLDWWVQGGAIGLVLLITLIGNTSWIFLKRKDSLSLLLMIGFLTAFSFNPASIVGLVSFWWLIGQSFINKKMSLLEDLNP